MKGLALYLAGVLSTIVGSWIASKIRMYHDSLKAHRDDLKQKILTPLRTGMHEFYKAPMSFSAPVVFTDWGTDHLLTDARASEQPKLGGPILRLADPRRRVEQELDEAFVEDATENHYADLMRLWGRLPDSWSRLTRCYETWVSEMSSRIVEKSGLAAHPAPDTRAYFMHFCLAVFVYRRLFQIEPQALKLDSQAATYWLSDGTANVAAGTKEQMEKLLTIVDGLILSEKGTASKLRQKTAALGSDLLSLSHKISLELASQRLPHRCPLVRFF